jgi:ABC-type oligopeptide transport system substrate-binding subunit
MRKVLIGGALGVLILALSACGGSSGTSEKEEAVQREADLYEISQIERSFHEAIS